MTARDATGQPEAVEDVVKRVNRTLDKVDDMAGLANNRNTAKIEVNAGGIGLAFALAACALMLGINLGLAIMVVNHDRKIDELNNYLNAIYMMAPHLKPEKKG